MSAIDPSAIDTTQPPAVAPTTAGVRGVFTAIAAQFTIAKTEITALQALMEDPIMGGTPIPGTAGANAAGAQLDISAATGLKCVIATEGPIRVRFGLTPVSDVAYHLILPAGTSEPFVVGAAITQLSAWGEGGAWNFNLVPVE